MKSYSLVTRVNDFITVGLFPTQNFVLMMTSSCYIGVDFTFGLLACVHYNEDFIISRFVISRFCSIHFTVTLAGLKDIVHYTEDFVT